MAGVGLWSGPLPKPSDLEEYDRILPGAADRIITRFELQQRNQHTYRMAGRVVSALAISGAIAGVFLQADPVGIIALAASGAVLGAGVAIGRFFRRPRKPT